MDRRVEFGRTISNSNGLSISQFLDYLKLTIKSNLLSTARFSHFGREIHYENANSSASSVTLACRRQSIYNKFIDIAMWLAFEFILHFIQLQHRVFNVKICQDTTSENVHREKRRGKIVIKNLEEAFGNSRKQSNNSAENIERWHMFVKHSTDENSHSLRSCVEEILFADLPV